MFYITDMEHLNIEDFKARDGLVCQRKDGLILFDYSKTIQFNFDWDEISIAARGIVFEESTGRVVARGYDKFFNYEELRDEAGKRLPVKYQPNFAGEFMALDKLDGSCGICYFYNGEWRINTRGSFSSDQAIWGKQWFDANIKSDTMNRDWTYIFEIIYRENRIVVEYDYEGLVLTGIRNTQTGEELWYDVIQAEASRIGCRVTTQFIFTSLKEMLSAKQHLTINEEGYVVTYRNGYKFKLKGDAYCKLHRAMCAITPLHFWRAIDWAGDMKMPREFSELLPEEFKETTDTLSKITEGMHQDKYQSVAVLAGTIPNFADDRDGKKMRYEWITANIADSFMRSLVLEYIRGKYHVVKDVIHRSVRPTANSYDGIDLDPRLKRILEES